MRIRHVSIKGLYGLFDHSVPLNLEDRLTIIHGANGLGKTALLRLLKGFFSLGVFDLEEIPFQSFEIAFDDSSSVVVQRVPKRSGNKGNADDKRSRIHFVYSPVNKAQEEYTIPDNSSRIGRFSTATIDLGNLIPQLREWGAGRWIDIETENVYSYRGAIRQFQEYLPPSIINELLRESELPQWLNSLRNSIDVHFIAAQRLVSVSSRHSRHTRTEGPAVTEAVHIYSDEITRAIKNQIAEYAELSQSLDSTFPERLMQQNREKTLASDELRDRLTGLEYKRQALQAAGLLEEEQGVRFQMPEDFDTTTQKVLSVYVQDIEKKLGVFDTIAAKIDLLRKIVDDRFLFKRLTINREKGFVFTTDTGERLSPTQLSSGEQNELVLLYELLFKVKPDSLILIDEPEISLHVGWQQQFLRDLQSVIQLSPFDVLIATHSPHIIHDRWDLTVELNGRKERKK